MAYFNCFFTIKVFFFKAFNAYNLLVDICLTKNTLPKDPEPKVFII
jgi:hypothetical protein